MTYEDWQKACALCAEQLCVGGPDLWAADDPYDLNVYAPGEFENGVTPEAFIRDIFGEDLARHEHDVIEQEIEQLEHDRHDEDEDDDDEPYDVERGRTR